VIDRTLSLAPAKLLRADRMRLWYRDSTESSAGIYLYIYSMILTLGSNPQIVSLWPIHMTGYLAKINLKYPPGLCHNIFCEADTRIWLSTFEAAVGVRMSVFRLHSALKSSSPIIFWWLDVSHPLLKQDAQI
jgi:hypothetical protein